MNADLQRQLDDHQQQLDDIYGRLREVEMWRERAKGFLAGIALVATLPSLVLGWVVLTGRLVP